MSKIDNKDINKIAKLSRLSFSDEEAGEFSQQISEIISWVNKLDEVNTDNVLPMMAVDDRVRMREDKVNIENKTSEILQNSADTQFDFYAVPKFVE